MSVLLSVFLCLVLAIFIVVVCDSSLSNLISLYASLFVFFLSTVLYVIFDSSLGFQFLFKLNWGISGITFIIGVDSLSLFFILLTTFLFPVVILASWTLSSSSGNTKLLYVNLLLMELMLVLVFCSLDLFIFFFIFESLLLPMFLVIGIWGSSVERIPASFYFFLYTFISSLAMIYGIFCILNASGTTNYLDLFYFGTGLNNAEELVVWMCFFLSFAVNIPIFPFHIWLPEAHVEAPTIGSMLLAGLYLNLGGYGIISFLVCLFYDASVYFSSMVTLLCLLGIVYASIIAIAQLDVKKLIAYTSVAHMNFAVLGLFSFSTYSLLGSVILMLGHGFVSSFLFFLVGSLYDSYGESSIDYYSGLFYYMPVFSVCFFFATLSNLSFPFTVNFLAEVLVLVGLLNLNWFVMLVVLSGLFFSAVYSMLLFSSVVFGVVNLHYFQSFMDLSSSELLISVIFIFYILLFGFNLEFLTSKFIFNVT